MIQNEKVIGFVFQHLQVADFHIPEFKELLLKMHDNFSKGGHFNPTKTASYFADPKIAQMVAAALSEKDGEMDSPDRAARIDEVKDSIVIIKRQPLEDKIEILRKKIKEKQASRENVTGLMEEYKVLRNDLKKFDSYWEMQEME